MGPLIYLLSYCLVHGFEVVAQDIFGAGHVMRSCGLQHSCWARKQQAVAFGALAHLDSHWRASTATKKGAPRSQLLGLYRLIFLDRLNVEAEIKSLVCFLVYSIKSLGDFLKIQCFRDFVVGGGLFVCLFKDICYHLCNCKPRTFYNGLAFLLRFIEFVISSYLKINVISVKSAKLQFEMLSYY